MKLLFILSNNFVQVPYLYIPSFKNNSFIYIVVSVFRTV